MKIKSTLAAAMISLSLYSVAQPCLVSSYPFDGNANDIAGTSNGIVSGAILTADRFGNPNSAYSFDGASDHIDIPNVFDYPERTIGLWFNAASTSTTIGNIIVIDNPSLIHGNMSIVTVNSGGTDYVRFQGGGTAANFFDYPISTDTWYYVAVVKDATGYKYYVNCNLVSTKGVSNNSSSDGDAVTRLGAERLLSINRFFHGQIDNLFISDCALSTQEICNAYNAVADLYSPTLPLQLYPNPAQIGSNLHLFLPGNQVSNIQIINSIGDVIYTQPLNGQDNVYLDPAVFVPGMYIVRLNSGNQTVSTQKLILE